MDQILNKVGSYWLGKKANKQLDSVGDDINVRISLYSFTTTCGIRCFSFCFEFLLSIRCFWEIWFILFSVS